MKRLLLILIFLHASTVVNHCQAAPFNLKVKNMTEFAAGCIFSAGCILMIRNMIVETSCKKVEKNIYTTLYGSFHANSLKAEMSECPLAFPSIKTSDRIAKFTALMDRTAPVAEFINLQGIDEIAEADKFIVHINRLTAIFSVFTFLSAAYVLRKYGRKDIDFFYHGVAAGSLLPSMLLMRYSVDNYVDTTANKPFVSEIIDPVIYNYDDPD